jgi:hypothetical protein
MLQHQFEIYVSSLVCKHFQRRTGLDCLGSYSCLTGLHSHVVLKESKALGAWSGSDFRWQSRRTFLYVSGERCIV